MTARQVDHLVKMANDIALNMAACGNEQEVARVTGEHLQKFWTPAMLGQLIEYHRAGGADLSPAVARLLASLDEAVDSGVRLS